MIEALFYPFEMWVVTHARLAAVLAIIGAVTVIKMLVYVFA